jgi:hypothetical protein
LIFGGITVLSAGSAFAKKKKAPTKDEEPAAQKTDEAAPEKAAAPSAQVQDVEKPQRVLDNSQEAPKTDSLGHVHFGSPNGEGLGRVAVKAAPEQKIKVFLEGRYFGTAPLTIYSVPKGDYIVEGTIVSTGKQVSSPVSVSENEEASVELGSGKIETPAVAATGGGTGMFSGEISPRRLLLTKIFVGAAAAGLVGTVAFAILESGAESDYEHAPATSTQQQLDSISARGNRYATLTNVSLFVLGAGVAGAVIAGYPLVMHGGAEKNPSNADVTATPQALLTPVVTPGGAGAAFSMRF